MLESDCIADVGPYLETYSELERMRMLTELLYKSPWFFEAKKISE